jgi:hypothetical protein
VWKLKLILLLLLYTLHRDTSDKGYESCNVYSSNLEYSPCEKRARKQIRV